MEQYKGDIMNILNIALNEMKAIKKSTPKGSINVTNNIKITDLKETNMGTDKTRKAMSISFLYTSDYSPNIGDIELKGEVLVIEEVKQAEKIIEGWKKNKKLDQELAAGILNNIMNKCSFEALFLSRELGLPAPIQLPRIKQGQEPEPKKKK